VAGSISSSHTAQGGNASGEIGFNRQRFAVALSNCRDREHVAGRIRVCGGNHAGALAHFGARFDKQRADDAHRAIRMRSAADRDRP
jgi:hypothetical protein